jgi:serine protease Do/serine protease DegQ
MKFNHRSPWRVIGVVLIGFGIGLGARGAEAAKKAVLRIDATPVAEGARPGVVASYADVIEPALKSVVSVHSAKIVRQRIPINPLFRQFFGGDPEQESKQEGLGSGVIVSSNGYILTNNHVVEGADELKVMLPDEREFPAKVIGTDPKTDVAVIKIDAENLPCLTLADSDKLRVGDVVFAVGNPLNVGQTVTMGIVSALGRRNLGLLDDVGGYENFIQTDAAINMGNSGGALVDARGRLVGVNSAIISTSRGNIGIGFAIPINLASSIMQSLVETGTVARGFLGVSIDPLTPELADALGLKDANTKGVVITQLTDNSPAKKAGLKREDVIVAINDKPVTTREELRLNIAQMPPGTNVKLQVLRDGNPLTIDVTLGKLADEIATNGELLPGVQVAPVSDDLRRQFHLPDSVTGLVVIAVDDNSPYRDYFPAGAVIEQINRQSVDAIAGVSASLHPGKNIALVNLHGAYRYVVFNVK